MAKDKEKDDHNGFKINDNVMHQKSGVAGRIHDFERSGVVRAVIEGEVHKTGYYVLSVWELTLVSRPEDQVAITRTLDE